MDPSNKESSQLCSRAVHERSSSACRCPILQTQKSRCGGLTIFLSAISFVYFAKALTGSYLKSSITQIERRFELPSSLVGVIDGSFEIGNLLVITLVSYFGAKLHRPKLIGSGCLVMSVGTFLIALPHFIMGRYMYDRAPARMSNTSSSPCLQDIATSQNDSTMDKSHMNAEPGCQRDSESYLWIYILLGNLLRGIGEAPIQPLGISYIDDYAAEDNAAFYIGCILTAAVIGPIFGFLLGSLCASLFVDVGAVDLDRVTITPKDERWVGAWWLGYLVAGVISILATIPFWFIPKEQPRSELRKNSSTPSEQSKFILEELRDQKVQDQGRLLTMARDFFPSLKELLGNPVFFLYLCGSVFQYNSLVGMVTYKPKYIEQQYGQTSSRTNFIIGLINVPAVAMGIFLGGVVMKKFRINIVGAAKLLLSSSVIGYAILMSLFGMGCERSSVAGLTVSYAGYSYISQEDGALAECNVHCLCPQSHWEPVCGDNGITYYSACYAGCHLSNGTGKVAVYSNCSCVTRPPLPSGGRSAVPGPCSRGTTCSRMFLYFMVISVITSFTLSFGGTPGYILLLRCIKPELKSLALGIYTMAVRVLAGVPAPMYFGALIDSVCLKWGSRQCSGKGSCRLYNTDAFRFIYLGMTLALGVVFLSLSTAVLYILKKQCPTGKNSPSGNGCKRSSLPSNLVGNVHLLQSRYWMQKETRL
ncbi:solute carrier organic anion transporter family member 1C1-like isoform X1 [Bufo gargarizans]|uniref:solute carrier organic anion transporter family member 1C1-like isoform X1 n=1 Tax=Bufo gargarizans TaxID=30331 RepID=UPI001CF47EDE|nr:solute carrier organic anion transporter family member 1C1-like isoform X1 [Bufo gargarizans]